MRIQEQVLLKQHCTFRVGGPAKFFVEVTSLDELREAIGWAKKNQEKIFLLGGGSNVLFMDSGFSGLVIKLKNLGCELKGDFKIECQAGELLGGLVRKSLEVGCSGMEWAAGIPGTIGGAIRGNAGAFGKEIKDVVILVEAFKIVGDHLEVQKYTTKECKFDYRNSLFKETEDLIIWRAEFKLEPGNKEDSLREVREILNRRKNSHPAGAMSAGSMFKNPLAPKKVVKLFEEDKQTISRGGKVPAGWLIEQCNLKGKRIGGAEVSQQQANFIVNTGNATSEEIMILLSLIKTKARNQFGVKLEEEVQIVHSE
ncbi:MAG TPA: UDP-N-acetylmuramate dehydrogenase [Candidatus Moranbacteria bacterium]|nr:UDP-N-acetylmuramate dehydrogenase [Candidatus Moranbacteria bacterium]